MINAYRLLLSLLLIALQAFIAGCRDKPKIPTAHVFKNTSAVQKADGFFTDSMGYGSAIGTLKVLDTTKKWNQKKLKPLQCAILPYNRVVAFYGNLYSKRMGILGALPKEQMLAKLKEEVAVWRSADPSTPVIPALHYIAITAQKQPGKNKKYRLRMPFQQIDSVYSWARSINGIIFLDVQIGQSTVKEEVETLRDYLALPDVHLALDPEFAMKHGAVPGSRIGTLSALEINEVIAILEALVKDHNLPPKILVIHRFTRAMLTDYQNIKICPEVQIVINMDGFGSKELKRSSYRMAIYEEPVQFAGFKLFYKNDTQNGQPLLTPEELLQLVPKPVYIQYQ